MGRRFLFLILFMSGAASAGDYKAANCEDSGFILGAWQDLIQQEPRILRHLKDIAEHAGVAGPDVPMTNCWVKWPVDDKGESIRGLRTAVLDKVWIKPDGTSHGGMKILYNLKYEGRQKVRSLRGLSICWGQEACANLGIPFAPTPEAKPQLIPLAPPPSTTVSSDRRS